MTAPPTSAPPAPRREDDSSAPDALSKRRDTRSTGGAGDGRSCGACRWWTEDAAPGQMDAIAISGREHYRRVLDAEPCGWCKHPSLGADGGLLLFASMSECGVFERRKDR